MTRVPGAEEGKVGPVGRRFEVHETLEVHQTLLAMLGQGGVAIEAEDLLLIGTGALHLCGIPARVTDDLDFLVRSVSAAELASLLAPLPASAGLCQYAEHVFGLSTGGGVECDLISPHDRGVHEGTVEFLFAHARSYGPLRWAASEDVFTLKLAALADRLVRGAPLARMAKYRDDVGELVPLVASQVDLSRMEAMLRCYAPAIFESAMAIAADLLQREGRKAGGRSIL